MHALGSLTLVYLEMSNTAGRAATCLRIRPKECGRNAEGAEIQSTDRGSRKDEFALTQPTRRVAEHEAERMSGPVPPSRMGFWCRFRPRCTGEVDRKKESAWRGSADRCTGWQWRCNRLHSALSGRSVKTKDLDGTSKHRSTRAALWACMKTYIHSTLTRKLTSLPRCYHRSTSPNTRSMVPMMATASANKCPRAM